MKTLPIVAAVAAVAAVACSKSKPAEKIAEGPPIAGTAQLGEAPVWTGHRVVLHPDGAAVVMERDAMVSFDRTGAQRWRIAIDHDDWLVELADGSIVLSDHKAKALVALDVATGSERWRAALPVVPDVDEYDFTDRNAEAGVVFGDRIAIALADARFFTVDPARCAKQEPCIDPLFTLKDETIDDPMLIAGPDGDLILGETGAIRRLSADGHTVAAFHVRDSLGGVALMPGGKLAAVIDDELVIYELAACTGPRPVALSRKRGRMYVRGEGECDDCSEPPRGCLFARPSLDDIDFTPPLVLADGSVVVGTEDGLARVSAGAKIEWTSAVGVFGVVRPAGGLIVGLASGVGDDLEPAPLSATAIDVATGKVVWKRQLAVKAGFIISLDDLVIAAAPGWLVVGYKGALSWLPLAT